MNESVKDKERKTLKVEISNLDENDLLNFQKMFTCLGWSGSVGASRDFKVYSDGDGSFRAKFKMDPEPDEEQMKDAIEQFDNEKLRIGFGC